MAEQEPDSEEPQRQEADPYWDSKATLYDEVQKNVFTNWINHRLRLEGRQVKDLQFDLDDGVVLINLLEVLSPRGEKMPKNYKSPHGYFEKSANLTVAFQFMTGTEHIRLEGIGPDNLREHNLMRILGLVWSLILRYQLPVHDGNGDKSAGKVDFEKLLLGWVQASLPNNTVKDFTKQWSHWTTEWNDGRNLSALIDYCKPGLIPEHASLSPDMALENISTAMDLACKHFNVPKIMRAEDLATKKPDKRSFTLYLSHFCCPDASGEESIGQKVLLEWIQKQIPKQKITNFTTDWMNGCSLGALIDVISGGGFPEYKDMDPTEAVENCSKSLDAAERLLSIEKSVSAEVFAKKDTNQLIRMTYLTHLRFATPSRYPPQSIPVTVEIYTSDSKETVESKPEVTKVFVTVTQPKPGKHGVFIIEHPHQYKVSITEIAEAVDPVVGTTRVRSPPCGAEDVGDRQYANNDDFHGSMTVVGDASLSATSQGMCGKPTIDLVDEGKGQFAVTVAASEPDDYQVSIMWGGEHVPGSPFQLVIRDRPRPDRMVCTGPHYEVGSTQPVTLEVNAEKGGEGNLSALCCGNKKGSVPVHISEDVPKRYTLRFTPPDFDTYTLSVLWSEEHVKDSPFTVDVAPLPPDASKCVVIGPEIPPEMSSPVSFKVEAINAGHGELSARAIGQAVGEVSVDIFNEGDGQFAVTVATSKPDNYQVSIMWGGEHVPGSPFQLVIRDRPRPDRVVCTGPHYEVGSTQPVTLEVNAEKGGEGNLSALCCGNKKGSVPVHISEDVPKRYTLRFTPPDFDTYTLSVLWSEEHVKDSPFTVDVAPLPPDASKCVVIGPEIPPEMSSPVSFEVDASNAGHGELSARAIGQAVGEVSVDIVNEGNGQFAVTVATSKPDDYQVSIMWGGEHVPGSPFQLVIRDRPRPDRVVCTGPHYEVGSTQPVTLEVNAEKGGEGNLSALCCGNKESSVPVDISEDVPKRYTLRFTPPDFDTYTLSVLWSEEHVKDSPFTIDVAPLPPDASKCVVIGPEIPPEMSAPVTFKVDTSNAGHGELSAKAVGQTAGQASVDIEEKEPNVFDVFFICPKPDKYDLSMEWSSQPVPGSPFSLNLSTPNASKVTIAKAPNPSVRDGQPIVISFNTSQAGRGNLTATCSGSDVGTVNVVVTKNPDSTYNVEFVPPDIDLYTLSIFWNGVHIKRSPFTINLAPPIIGNVKIIGPTYSLSGPVELMLQTRGAGKGTVTGSCISIDKDTIPVSITETSHECYLLTFQPPKPNIYTFGVQFGGENLKGSPFCINTIPPDASKVIVTEPKALEVSEPIVFQCNVLEAGPGKLSSSCNGKSSGSVPVEITEKSQGQYNLSFNPPTPDIYTVRISLAGQQVPKSPFTINLLPPNAAMVKVMDVHVPDEAGLGKEAWIDLDCSETGPAELEGECSGEHVLKVPTEIVTLRPDVYRAKFEAKEGDNYRFAIRYGNEQLQDSPFIISVNSNTSLVHEPQIAIPQDHPPECIYVFPQVTTTKEETRSSPITTVEELILYVGDPLQIAIHTQTAEQRSGVLSTTAVGEKTGQAPITSLQDPDGQFDVTFVPTKLDRYTVEMAINGVPIPNSPIVVKCIARPADAGKCFLFGLDDSGGTFDVDKEITFGVNVQEAGEGTLSVTADGPCDDARRNQLTALQSSTDSCIYNVTYIPTAAGLHRVHVQWAQENVPGSPLKFEVGEGAEMPTYTENPVVFEITASGLSGKVESHAIHKKTGNRIEVNVASIKSNKLNLSFQASDPGIYLVHVFFNKHEIQGSPFEVNYCPAINQPDPTPEPQTVSGMIQRSESREVEFETALKEAETINIVEVGRQTSVRVKNGLPDSFRCVGEKAGEVDTLLTEEDEAESHIVSFVPITEDNYKLCVKCLSEEKCYLVKAVERKLLSPSYVHPNGAEALVEVNTCVNVVVLDDSTDDLTVSTIGPQGLNRSSITGSVGDCIGIGFTPSTVGDYFVHIKKSNSEVGDSPYKVSIGKRDTKVLLQVEKMSIDYERECFAKFLVSATDPGKLEATVSGPGKSNLKVTDKLDGTYSCALYPSIPGNYNISVMWNRYHIPGSPFTLTFKPKKTLAVVGLDLDNETLFLYVPYRFQVDCDDLPQGELQIKCKPSSAAIVTANLIPGTRRYQCEIIPQEEGNRAIKAVYKADLENYKSKRIIGSPFNVIFRPLGDASKCIIANTSASHVYAIGDCALVSVSTEGAGKGKLTAFAANSASDGSTLPVTVTKVGKHKFDIEFSPDEPADYLVNVFFDGKNIPESPLRVVFCDPKDRQGLESHGSSGGATAIGLDSTLETSPSEPSNVRAYGPGLKSGFVGQEGSFIVSTGKAGTGVFGIRANGPKGAFQLKIRQHPENERTIIARYDPAIAGTYSFDITWSDVPIPGSPFYAVIVEQH